MELEPSGSAMGRVQSPQGGSQHDRPLNVTDALSYLDAVKSRFHDRTDVYNRFLDIMKDFKTQVLVSVSPPSRLSLLLTYSIDFPFVGLILPELLSGSHNSSMLTQI
jgi:hypothetical protein